MLKYKQRNKNNKSYPKNKNDKSKTKEKKELNENKMKINTINKSTKANISSSSSNNSSISKKKKTKKIKEPEIKKEKKFDEELIKKQYKIIKDFLIPILKEQNAKELVSCYNKMTKDEKKLMSKNKSTSLRNKPILEYSFVTGKSRNKLKIPLFQILTPKQFKNHLEKKNRERIYSINRPCKNTSTTNLNNINILSETRKVKSSNDKITTLEAGPINNIINNNEKIKENNNQNNINDKNDIKNSSIIKNINSNVKALIKNNNEIIQKQNNNNMKGNIYKKNNKIKDKINRSKTPPLYLRINEVRKKHNEVLQKLREKYEYNYKDYNINKYKKKEENSSSSEISDTSSSIISINKTKTKNDFEKWYNYEKTWQKMKDMKLNIIKSELEENKICMNIYNKQQETFKPKINKNCDNLLLKRYDGDFYNRLKNYKLNKERKEKLLKQKLKPKFKPYVNVNYNINKEYYLYMKYDQKKINKDLNYFLEKY